MTQQLDPWEVFVDTEVLAKTIQESPDTGLKALAQDFELGAACNLGDTECEACQ